MPPTKVLLRVPATSANLGPGFDCLGLALDMWSRFTFEVRHPPKPPPDDPLLVATLLAMDAVYEAVGRKRPDEVAVSWQGDLPLARGLGASAVARGAGLLGANALNDSPLHIEDLLLLGAKLEGHADNIVPALLGGLQVSVWDDNKVIHVPVPLPPRIRVVLLVPDRAMPTDESRRLLPAQLPRADAVYNISRAALLIAALASERLEVLDTATGDRLHQPARSALLPGMYEIIEAARKAGALCAYLSGGGSAIAAWTVESEEAIATAMSEAAAAAGSGGRTIVTRPSDRGSEIMSVE